MDIKCTCCNTKLLEVNVNIQLKAKKDIILKIRCKKCKKTFEYYLLEVVELNK